MPVQHHIKPSQQKLVRQNADLVVQKVTIINRTAIRQKNNSLQSSGDSIDLQNAPQSKSNTQMVKIVLNQSNLNQVYYLSADKLANQQRHFEFERQSWKEIVQ